MRFYRRDLVLLAASVLFTMAGAMYLGVYAIGIGAALFFGMKTIAVRRQEGVEREVGEGLCAECGQRVVGGRCPDCAGPAAAGGSGAGAHSPPAAGGPDPGSAGPPAGGDAGDPADRPSAAAAAATHV